MRVRALPIALAALLAVPATAQAHVELTPDVVAPGGDALFTVKSPNESTDQPLTGLLGGRGRGGHRRLHH